MKYGIANVKAKSGGGGADLNLAYGLTPPTDTTKIWVKCEEPSAVKVEANRQLVVSSDENAKLVETDAILSTYRASATLTNGSHNCVVKEGNFYYVGGYYDSSNNNFFFGNYFKGGIYKINSLTNDIETLYSENQSYAIWKYDASTLLTFNSSLTTGTIKFLDINTNEEKNSFTFTVGTTTSKYLRASFLGNNHLYGCYIAGIQLTIGQLDLNTKGFSYNQFTISNMFTDVNYIQPVYYNGYLYFIIPRISANGESKLARWQIGSNSIEELVKVDNIIEGNNKRAVAIYDAFVYGNKMIVTNIAYSSSVYDNRVLIIDLDTNNIETLVLDATWRGAYAYVEANTGNIILLGGGPTSSGINLKKKTIYNIYSLEENTLDLYYDTLSSLNIKLMDTPTITMDAPINHAWLGDSNDIAQPVDFFYYKNSLWWGVNCLGYTQLSNCVISASDVSIDLANATSDTQTITITPTWANETGVITTSVATSDDTLATATLSGDSLTINALAVGTPTITISVADEYGTTYTKSITITITNSGA